MNTAKERVRQFWDQSPCGAQDAALLPERSREFLEEIERQRFSDDDFMFEVCRFESWAGKSVLEVGCGLGTDLIQFARAGARVHGTDLTERSIQLTRKRFLLEGVPTCLVVGDSERLPSPDDRFDLVYCWGVIHHTPREVAARELIRVCRPGGRVLAMVYHRRSLFVLEAWLVYALGRGRPWPSPSRVIAEHVESPDTQAHTIRQAHELFAGLNGLSVTPIVTRYDLRIGRRRFLPTAIRRLVPRQLGWFLVVEGTKPLSRRSRDMAA
jgi:ubiquinone/menaquinone biosynthesis C-methylase UbiE